jgi:hypothetical protein
MENRLFRNVGGFRQLSAVPILLAILLSCCAKEERPAGILSREQMVKVLMDIYITEEKVNRLSLRQDSALAVFDRMEQKIFERAGAKDSMFEKSFDYYFSRPEELHLIYSAVVDSLQLKEQRTPDVPKLEGPVEEISEQ